MSILPENKPHASNTVPRNFFIWGDTMSGKSYLASKFPSSIVLSTDDNEATSGTRPSIPLKNVRDARGNLKTSVVDTLDKAILALDTETHTYKTVVIDVIEDVCTLIEQAICIENNVKSLADIQWGKGFAMFNSALAELVQNLKGLNMNVVYISRAGTKTENNVETPVPALKQKYYNVVNGNCDLVIRTQHLGKNYIRTATDIRKHYKASEIKDEHILNILKAIPGALVKETPQTNNKEEGK
ncbi:hypothetical protein RD055328_08660 [Companilactobacillus sp. RD055328]|uniref:AAA family ATPase n=1 Tax=Companilactobacillus sp. RD055328 TaxID=2916634 RepID=UPI001FC7C4F1|nr:AAA family ATPase [Companilactobacillus sp. RD055328]GKQ42943.1 hypothetical protein RD055328_08660 [Companilactobacillus sp. RD055328]